MENNFSEEFKEALSFSRTEALGLGNDFIGVEHLLLGILKSGYLNNIFDKFISQNNIIELKKNIEIAIEDSKNKNFEIINSLPLTKQAEKVIRITVLESKNFKNSKVELSHLLLALLKQCSYLFSLDGNKYLLNYEDVYISLRGEKLSKLASQKNSLIVNQKATLVGNFEKSFSKISNNEKKILLELFESHKVLLNSDTFSLNKNCSVVALLIKSDTKIDFNNIISLLERLNNLDSLEIKSDVFNIESLSKLNKLKKLCIASLDLVSIAFLNNFNQLTHLELQNNSLSDIKEIERVISSNPIEYLNIFNNNFSLITRDVFDFLFRLPFNKYLAIALRRYYVKIQLFENAAMFRDLEKQLEYGKIYSDFEITNFRRDFLECLFKSNKTISPSIDIVLQGYDATLRYFDHIDRQGLDYIYEAKLTLVGDGGGGKTSLQYRLVDEKAVLPSESTRTRGIVLTDWFFNKEKDKSNVAHIWDFGGQDMYYPVHRFFITENSVFVLLSSTRFHNHNFDYWIPTIFQFGNNSPILIGQTCHDGNKKNWNDLGTYLANPNFNIIKNGQLPYIELNLLNNNEGLKEIESLIISQIMKLGKFGKGVPKSYLLIRTELLKISKDNTCITFDDFSAICKNINLEHFKKYNDITDCCLFFHDIGVVLWYSDNIYLRNWVILQPEWAMNAVYLMIDDSDIQERKGHIIPNDFERLWGGFNSGSKKDILKTMLEAFKITFPKKHLIGEYILPARLESIPLELIWNNLAGALLLIFKFDFMPKGLVNQLSAELSRYIESDNDIWNNAVNFIYGNTKTTAQVFEDFSKCKIKIIVVGNEARELITLIKNALHDILDGYKGVKPEILVPCSCSVCTQNAEPHLFLYNKLLEWRYTKENGTVVCNESSDILYIDELLYNVGLNIPEKTDILIDLNLKQKTRLFISYSKADDIYIKEFISHIRDENRVEIFYDRDLQFTNKMEATLLSQIENCDYFICIASQDLLNTDFVIKKEIPLAKKHDKIIIPIILKPCNWESSIIGDCQAVLKGKIITIDNNLSDKFKCVKYSDEERAFYWLKAAEEIREKTRLLVK
jgi:internalin A